MVTETMNATCTRLNDRKATGKLTEGFTLVELMVGVALGIFLLIGVVTVFTSTVRGSADNLRSARMNQELSAAMEMMVGEIRRAGYTHGVTGVYTNASTGQRTLQDIRIPSAGCILYSYNENLSGALDNNERHGFKRVVEGGIGRIEFGTNVSTCTGDWPDLTDPAVVDVTALQFTTTGSKCLNRGPTTPRAYWVTTNTDDAVRQFPCDATDDNDITYYSYNGTGYNLDDFVAPDTGDRTVETRQLTIFLRGQAVRDNPVEKELRADVKVRNNFARTH